MYLYIYIDIYRYTQSIFPLIFAVIIHGNIIMQFFISNYVDNQQFCRQQIWENLSSQKKRGQQLKITQHKYGSEGIITFPFIFT